MGIENLNFFFNPKTIAVVGASDRETSLGGLILRNLCNSYQGKVFPVNVFRQTVNGVRAYPSIGKIPVKIDLAIVATPASTIPEIVEECGLAGVQGIIIVSAGLSECDLSGKEITGRVTDLGKKYGTRIIGPNSLGVIRPRNNLYATFGNKKAVAGKIAFISQSAALCGTILDWAQENNIGLSAVVSVGSMVDVSLSDVLEYLGADAQTRVITLYVESIKNVRAFMSTARGYARTKPIIIVKGGRFNKNRELALAKNKRITEDEIYRSAFKRIGIVRVDTVNELFNCAKALSMQPNPSSHNLTIISNADGPGVLAADQLNLKGGRLSPISEPTLSSLKSILPYYCRLSNPIDLLEETTPERFKDVLQICLKDPACENILLIYSPQGVTKPSALAKIVADLSETSRKTFLVTFMGESQECQEARRVLHSRSVPTFTTVEEAVTTFMNMHKYTRNLELLYQTPEETELALDNPQRIKGVIRHVCAEGRQALNLQESLTLLETYHISTADRKVAMTAQEAVTIASKLGYPVLMKPTQFTPHPITDRSLESEVCSSSEVKAEFNCLKENFESMNLTNFQGIALQRKPRNRGIYLFLGAKRHHKFGKIIVLGKISDTSGVINDVAIGFPPLNQVLAKQLIEAAKLSRYELESGIHFNHECLEKELVRFSQLILDLPEIEDIKINPLFMSDNHSTVIDANVTIDVTRIMRESADHVDNLIIAPYPKKYLAQRKLKNGLLVNLRPIKPEDEPRFNELFLSLSQESVRFRFFQVIREMSHDTLSRFCNLDYDREISIVAEQSDGRIIGVVTLILDPDRRKGEFAIMVGDAWHSLGLGSKLMDHIIEIAKDLSVEAIYSLVSSANYKMLNLCSKMGFASKPVDETVVEMQKTWSL